MLSYVPIYFYKENVKLLLYLYVSVCISMGSDCTGRLNPHCTVKKNTEGFRMNPCYLSESIG
jgi:hypothetical protein